jgi:hypothetical protein
MFAIETRTNEGDEEYTNCITFTNEEDAIEHLATLNTRPGYHTLIDRDAPEPVETPVTEPDFDSAFSPANDD